jgi:glycine/D-amino acid oxidase-like deaminating enzyme
MNSQPQIVVLGAGVLGLTTALNLALEGNRFVTVVAKHMPGDHHPEYTSLWAGVNWVPYVPFRHPSIPSRTILKSYAKF